MFGRKKLPLVSITIKVDTSSSTWQTSARKVLNRMRGVLRFSLEESGTAEVVGNVDPEKLVKKFAKAGNQATVCWYNIPVRSTDGYVYLDRDLYGTAGYYTYGYEYRPYGGIVWPGYNGTCDWYRVNGYPMTHAADRSSACLACQFR